MLCVRVVVLVCACGWLCVCLLMVYVCRLCDLLCDVVRTVVVLLFLCVFVPEFVFVCFVFVCFIVRWCMVCLCVSCLFLRVCVLMCLSGVVVVDCVMWYGMLFVLFCVSVCRLLALFACVFRLWYLVRCCFVWFCVLCLCVCVCF